MSQRITDFEGAQLFPKTADYDQANLLYATTSHGEDHHMHPGLIIKPRGDKDIVAALKHARDRNLKISLKSGGHQYSGACSTDGPNIMMDLGETFKGLKDMVVLDSSLDKEKTIVYVSVSQSLGEFNAFLGNNKVFVPHGQCSFVHVGGHGQTGGYGQLGRSFGLFGDHIRSIRMFGWDAERVEDVKEVTKESDPELFYAILGGSPGNFGIITHYYVEVHRDADHLFDNSKPYAMWGVYHYNWKILQRLLDQVAKMADNPDMARNYDLCVSVLSSTYRIADMFPKQEASKEVRDDPRFGDLTTHEGGYYEPVEDEAPHDDDTPFPENDDETPDASGSDSVSSNDSSPPPPNMQETLDTAKLYPPVIVVYAQWVPFSDNDKYDPAWFKSLQNAGIGYKKFYRDPMSKITPLWIFKARREFKFPYDKRTYMTNSRSLVRDNWSKTTTGRIDMIISRRNALSLKKYRRNLYNGCCLAVQIQPFGGNESRFYANRDNGTSYSWRDSTVCQVLDCFYKSGFKATANQWQAENDAIMNGSKSSFSKQDKRVLWGSYNSWDLDKAWQFYYEDKEKYERIGRARGKADPKGTFTPNTFAVKAITS